MDHSFPAVVTEFVTRSASAAGDASVTHLSLAPIGRISEFGYGGDFVAAAKRQREMADVIARQAFRAFYTTIELWREAAGTPRRLMYARRGVLEFAAAKRALQASHRAWMAQVKAERDAS